MSETTKNKISTPAMAKVDIPARFESPLQHVELMRVTEPMPEHTTVEIEESKSMSHLILRGRSADPSFVAGVHAALQVELPLQACTSSLGDDLQLWWLSPDEWLIVGRPGEAGNIETALRSKLSGHFAVTDISGGQTLLVLSGSNAENVLKKSTPYDVDLRHFPIGKVVGTTLAKTQVHLRRADQHCFELILRRSFADYLWMWLIDASQEYGVVYRH